MSASFFHKEDCQLKQQGRLGLSHERGTGLGAGHLAKDTTSDLRCLASDENIRSAQRHLLDVMTKYLDGGSLTQIPQESPRQTLNSGWTLWRSFRVPYGSR